MLKVRMIWDVDCVLADMIPAICSAVLQRYGLSLTPNQIDQWDLRKVTGIPTIRQIFDQRMISEQPPIRQAQEYLSKIWDRTYSVLATYSMNDTFCAKAHWIKKHYPFVDLDSQLIFIKKKYLLDGDVFIDDNGQNCMKWLQRHPNGLAYMLGYRYNQKYKNVDKRLKRVDTWEQLVRQIDILLNFVAGCQNYLTQRTK